MLVLLFALFEIIDIFSQKSENFVNITSEYVRNFTKSPLLFLLKQGNFLLLAFCIFGLEIYNSIIICLFALYTIDLYMKISLIERIIKGRNLGIYSDLFITNPKISKKFRLVVLAIMILLFYIATA